nr:hypothetical protein [Brevundimonas diminuta]
MPPQSWANQRDYEAPAPLKAPTAPVPFWDAVNRNMVDAGQTRRSGAREEAYFARMWARHREIEAATGRTLSLSDTLNGEPTDQRDSLKRFMDRVIPADRINAAILGRPGSLTDDAYEAEVEKLRGANPEAFARIRSRDEILADLDADLRGIRRRADEASLGFGGATAAFVGQTAGMFLSDPGQVGVAVVTGGAGVGRPLLTRMAAQAAAGAGAETLEIGGRIADARYGGPEYTAGEAALDLTFAGAGGAAFEAIGAGGKAAWRATASRLARSEDPAERGLADQIERLLADETVLEQADDFDGARAALANGEARPVVEPERDLDSLFANQPDGPVLRSVAGSQPEIATAAPGALNSADYMGRTIWSGRFDPMTVEADAARFQYKGEGDAEGVTGRLRGVERWDATASGKAILFEDTDGRIFVADGHQRRGLARLLAEQGWDDARLDGYLFRASDGWNAREVRVVAALKNIREGSGAIMDAAKLFREAPGALRDRSLPVTGEFIQQARQLASLSDAAFRAVANGVIPERYGAVLGEVAGDRPELHGDLVDLIRRGEPGTADGARALVHEAMLDDFIASEGVQMDLFGGLPRESTVIARGRIREAVMRSLRKDERTFAALVKNADAVEAGGNVLARSDNEARLALDRAAQELVSRLSLRSGEIGEAFAEAAAAVTKGEATAAGAAKGLTQRIRNAVKAGDLLELERKALIDPDAPSPQALKAAEAFDQPGGRGQAAQIPPKPEDAELEGGRFEFEQGDGADGPTFWVRPNEAVAAENGMDGDSYLFGWVRDGELRIERAQIAEAARGKGLGVEMYERALREAADRGVMLASDSEVSADAQRVWAALERRGYAVQRHPGAVSEGGILRQPEGEAVFTVQDRPPPGLFDDLPTDMPEERALNVLRACAPGRG